MIFLFRIFVFTLYHLQNVKERSFLLVSFDFLPKRADKLKKTGLLNKLITRGPLFSSHPVECLMLSLEMVYAMMIRIMLNAAMIMGTVVWPTLTKNFVQNADAQKLELSRRLDFPKTMISILSWLGWYKFNLDNSLRLSFSVLM